MSVHVDAHGQNLTQQLLHTIQALKSGDRLPNERDLSATLGVSRTALRDRLQQFEAIGVLQRRHGSGTYVSEFSAPALGRLLSLGIAASGISAHTFHRVRVALEREAAGLAAQHGSKRQFDALERASDAFKQDLSANERFIVDLSFHRALLEASGDEGVELFTIALTEALTSEVDERTRRISQLTMPGLADKIWEVHHRIFEAVSARDVAGARDAVDGHFDWFDRTAPSYTS